MIKRVQLLLLLLLLSILFSTNLIGQEHLFFSKDTIYNPIFECKCVQERTKRPIDTIYVDGISQGYKVQLQFFKEYKIRKEIRFIKIYPSIINVWDLQSDSALFWGGVIQQKGKIEFALPEGDIMEKDEYKYNPILPVLLEYIIKNEEFDRLISVNCDSKRKKITYPFGVLVCVKPSIHSFVPEK